MQRQSRLATKLKDPAVRPRLIARLREDADQIRTQYEREAQTPGVEARLKRMRRYDPKDLLCPHCWDRNQEIPVLLDENSDDDEAFVCRDVEGHRWKVSST
jgi:hypothetical protein